MGGVESRILFPAGPGRFVFELQGKNPGAYSTSFFSTGLLSLSSYTNHSTEPGRPSLLFRFLFSLSVRDGTRSFDSELHSKQGRRRSALVLPPQKLCNSLLTDQARPLLACFRSTRETDHSVMLSSFRLCVKVIPQSPAYGRVLEL